MAKRVITEKTFIILSQEAIEGLKLNDAKETYKSLRNNTNKVWSSFDEIQKALSNKAKLNEEIEDLEEEIDDNPDDESLHNELDEILSSKSTINLIRDLENGFNQKPQSFVTISDSTVKMKKYKNNKNNKDKDNDKDRDKNEDKQPMDAKYDDIATYQSVVYGNNQMVLAKNSKTQKPKKSKSKKKKKKKNKTKETEIMDDDLDDYSPIVFDKKKESKPWDHAHDKDHKVIKAYSKNWDRDWDKIQKQREAIKRIKSKRKLNKEKQENDLKRRNSKRKESNKTFKNPHDKKAKNIKANSKNWDRDWVKIKKQREEIKRLKEKRKKEKEGKIPKRKRTTSFGHAHDRY